MKLGHWIRKFAVILALIASPTAFAGASFSIVAAPQYTMTGTGWIGGFAPLGGGLLLEFGGPRFGIELGGLYETRAYSTTGTYSCGEGKLNLNFKFSPKMFLTVGGWYDQQLSVSGTGLAGAALNDYGATGGLGFTFPLGGGSTAFRFDVEYEYSLRSVVAGVSVNQVEALVGLRFGGNK